MPGIDHDSKWPEADYMGKIIITSDAEAREYFPRRKKKKKTMVNEYNDAEFVLDCSIYHAEDVDFPPSRYPNVTERYYRAILWVEPGREFSTKVVRGLPNPVWQEDFRIILEQPWSCRFLNLEILRLNSYKTDPGTSRGVVTVGRAQIALPKEISTRKSGRFGLVKLQDMAVKGEGHIVLSMNLKKF